MKKSIIGFIIGVALMLSINVFAESFSKPTEFYIDGEKQTVEQALEVLGANVTITDTRIDVAKPTPVPTPEPVPTPTPTIIYEVALTDLEAVVKNTKDSCIMVYAYLPDGSTLQGSGWVYNGYVITAKHVVEGAEKIDIFTDGDLYAMTGRVHYIDTVLDVAIIKVSLKLPSVELDDSEKLIEGQKLVSITSPSGAQNSVDECINSGMVEETSGTYLSVTESDMEGGSSGGSVFDYNSQIVGMVVSGVGKTDYVLPINDLKLILKQID